VAKLRRTIAPAGRFRLENGQPAVADERGIRA
jgi:hypothetical protein